MHDTYFTLSEVRGGHCLACTDGTRTVHFHLSPVLVIKSIERGHITPGGLGEIPARFRTNFPVKPAEFWAELRRRALDAEIASHAELRALFKNVADIAREKLAKC